MSIRIAPRCSGHIFIRQGSTFFGDLNTYVCLLKIPHTFFVYCSVWIWLQVNSNNYITNCESVYAWTAIADYVLHIHVTWSTFYEDETDFYAFTVNPSTVLNGPISGDWFERMQHVLFCTRTRANRSKNWFDGL